MELFSREEIDKELSNTLENEPYYPVIIEEDSLSLVSKEGGKAYKCWLSTKMIVTKYLMDENSNQKYLEITATTGFGEETKEIPNAMLNRKDLAQILVNGWNYNETYTNQLIRYLVKSVEKADCIIMYDKVGWYEYDNVYLFRTDHIIEDEKNIGLNHQYKYTGQLQLNSQKNCDNYLSSLNELLITEGAMLAVAAGLSSAIISLLNFDTPIDNILIHIYGASSKGKTSFMRLALSCWGNPFEAPLSNEWNSTTNALYAMLQNNFGIAVGFDEASCTTTDFSTVIYNLSHGRDKAKCNKNSTLRKSKSWRTTIISTAEESLIAKAKRNNGIRARCIEFFNLKITENSEHAEKLNNFVRNNYGILGEKFIKLLYKKGMDNIYNDYEKSRENILFKVQNKCDITDRVSKSYAILLLSTQYAKELGVNIDIEAVLNILIEQHNSLIEEIKTAENLYNKIVEYILNNGRSFPSFTDDTYPGNYEGVCDQNSYFICESTLERILRNNGYTDVKVMIKELNRAGYLKKHNDRYYVKKTINGKQIKCYQIVNKNCCK